MRQEHKWVGYGKDNIKIFRTIKEIPSQAGIGIVPLRINFGIYGIQYALAHGDRIQLKDESWAEVFKARLVTHGLVIGPWDAEAAKNSDCYLEWRGAFHDRCLEKLGLNK